MANEKLIRGLGRWDMTAVVINTIIGAGIFGLPAKVYATIGAYSLAAFAACAVIIGLVVICYAEVASRFAATGGPYLYAREAFGSVVGFEVGWLYWIVRVATFAANCNLLVTYLGSFVPGANEGWLRIILVTLIVAIITVVNLIGVRESAVMTNIFTVGKLLPLVVFVCVGAFFVDTANFNFAVVPEYSAFASAVLLLIYAFVGFEASVVIAGETRDPGRSIPFGLITGICLVTVLYIAIQAVSIGTLPGLAESERPIADAAMTFLGPAGAAIVTVGVVVSIFGNLNVGVLSSTRLIYAMAEQRDLPRAFERIHSRLRTPYISIIATSAVILVLTIRSSFLSAVAIATITRLLVYATTCVSLPIFRRRLDVPEARFKAPLGIAAAILSVVLIVWLLTNVDIAKEGISIAVAAAVGLAIYLFTRIARGRSK